VSVVGRFSTENKEIVMDNCAEASRAYISSMLHSSHCDDLGELKALEGENLLQTLDFISLNAEDITVLLLDESGKILLRAGNEETPILEEKGVPQEVLDGLKNTDGYAHSGGNGGMFSKVKMLQALAIKNGEGEYRGAVIVCAESTMLKELLEVVIRMIMSSILWVLFAALIAVYFISERVIAPLREISSAAKRFASGKFDVRVPVRGNDEVSELAATFNNMAESLDNYDNMRNSFMSNVSHDLRSPMTSISGFIDGILDGVIPPEQHTYYLQIVSSEIKRLSRLVNTLLDLSRIQAGDRKFTPVSFDICEMARQILISFEQKITAKGLDVEFDCPDERINVLADLDAIYQVFYNVCDNAVKFAEDGGKFRISVKRAKGRKVHVSIYNEGQGIAPADINYVFERFYKSDKSRGLNKNGTGLGLFISKTIIESHNEQIWVESEYGKNCCFTFSLEAE
jgi:signal transduction histidine kinase